MSRFNIKIDGGPERYFYTKSGVYKNAVAAIPAMLEVEMPFDVEIWIESLIPEYGPYFYRVSEDKYGNIMIQNLVQR